MEFTATPDACPRQKRRIAPLEQHPPGAATHADMMAWTRVAVPTKRAAWHGFYLKLSRRKEPLDFLRDFNV